MTITESMTDREAQIAGLHELADFLATHPDVPVPMGVHIAAVGDAQALAGWVDGLDTLDIRPGTIEVYRKVTRTFQGLEVHLSVRASQLGEEREVPSVVTELVPFTPEQIRERAGS